MDFFYLGVALAFFVVTAVLVHACERLRGGLMTGIYILSGLVAASLFVYLVYALFRPEKF